MDLAIHDERIVCDMLIKLAVAEPGTDIFFEYLGASRRRTPRIHVGPKEPKDASHPSSLG